MILYVDGNMFASPAQVLVNPVNTVGVMGKGMALEFKRLYPEMYKQYKRLCKQGQFSVGKSWLYKTQNQWVLNFPTKQHWRTQAHIKYISDGLNKFCKLYGRWGIHSIAFPALGCGNGGLDFDKHVHILMEAHLRCLPIDIFIYPSFVKENNSNVVEGEVAITFSTVWRDVNSLLAKKEKFQTILHKNQFFAKSPLEKRAIDLYVNGQTYTAHYDSLFALWKQLRGYGFSMRHIVPRIGNAFQYLVPIFAELPYVTTVRVAEHYRYLYNNPVVGLKILNHFERSIMVATFP